MQSAAATRCSRFLFSLASPLDGSAIGIDSRLGVLAANAGEDVLAGEMPVVPVFLGVAFAEHN